MTDNITLPRSVVKQALEALNASMPHNNDMDEDWPSHIAARRALRAALEQPQSPYGECDECGTPYSYDPTDGGCICVRCMKEKLATKQPQVEQEPVAWINPGAMEWGKRQCEKVLKLTRKAQPEYDFTEPLYTRPPARQPLTDAQIDDHMLALLYDGEDLPDPWDFKRGVRAAERAHGIGGEA